MSRLAVKIGQLNLKNPVICGSGEHTIEPSGIRQALRSGAAAVVAKSINESIAAKEQLDKTDYMLFDASWNPLDWHQAPPADASLFCRSGLVQRELDSWLEELKGLDEEAQQMDAYVIPSLILSDLQACVDQAKTIQARGFRVLEVNIGAPHASEAAKGAIVLERQAQKVFEIVHAIRQAVQIPLWIKLTGQSEDVVSLASAAQRAGADSVIMMGRFMGFIADVETGQPFLGTSAAIGGSWALPLTARWLVMTRQALGPQYPLIATNGARTGLDVIRFLMSGAIATEMSSAVWSGGYGVLSQAINEVGAYLERKNTCALDLLGQAADQIQTYQAQVNRPGYWRTFKKDGGPP
jgi:dihydropyrimidine dehydrogenase (NAD+) subunit PreA/dihydroorotate dehydrogenase (NAD+) catalytic subunit